VNTTEAVPGDAGTHDDQNYFDQLVTAATATLVGDEVLRATRILLSSVFSIRS
jgi:hypothetical protein